MTDSVPPSDGHTPQVWRNPDGSAGQGGSAHQTAPQVPAFDPRRAAGGLAAHSTRPATQTVTAPPPLVQDNLPRAAPRPYDPPSHNSGPYQGDPYAAAPYQTGAPYPDHAAIPTSQQAAPPYPAQHSGGDAYPGMAAQNPAYAPQQFDQNAPYDPNYGGQPAYAYPQATVPTPITNPAGGRASLLSRLTGRGKTPPSPAPYPDQQPETGPVTASARKPFLMGLLTGVVIMLILGQIFRAAQPSPDYAQAQSPMTKTVTSDPVAGEPEVLAFLETVEGLN